MANYSKSTNFAVKDSLTTGDPNKIVSGTEIDTEFNGISSMSSTKIDKVGGATAGNVATLTSDGKIQDSNKTPYDENNLKTDLDATGDAPIYAARAWLIGGSGGTVQNSKNVSSLTEVQNGEYVVNLEEAMDSANYCTVVSPFGQGPDEFTAIETKTASTFTVISYKADGSLSDATFSAVVFS